MLASPSSQHQLVGHCLGNKQTHSIALKSSAAGQLPARPFGYKKQKAEINFSLLGGGRCFFILSVSLTRSEFNILSSFSEVFGGMQTVGQASLKCG